MTTETTCDCTALAESIRPTLESIVRQSDGLVTFDPAGVHMWTGENGERVPAIGWWLNDDKLPIDGWGISLDFDVRAVIVECLRKQAAQLVAVADRIERNVD